MPLTIANSTLQITPDPRVSLGPIVDHPDPQRGYFATVTTSCEVVVDNAITNQEGYHLTIDLKDDENDVGTLIAPLTWADTTATGGATATGIFRLYSSTPAGSIPVTRVAYVAHNLLDVDPATPIFTPWGRLLRRQSDSILAEFTLTKFSNNGPPHGTVEATSVARTTVTF